MGYMASSEYSRVYPRHSYLLLVYARFIASVVLIGYVFG